MKKSINIEAVTLFVIFVFALLCTFAIKGYIQEDPSLNVILPDSPKMVEPMELRDLTYPVTEYDIDKLACNTPKNTESVGEPPARPHAQSRPFAWNRDFCGCCNYMPWTDSWCEVHRKEGFEISIFYPNGTSNITVEHQHKNTEDLSALWKMRHPPPY